MKLLKLMYLAKGSTLFFLLFLLFILMMYSQIYAWYKAITNGSGVNLELGSGLTKIILSDLKILSNLMLSLSILMFIDSYLSFYKNFYPELGYLIFLKDFFYVYSTLMLVYIFLFFVFQCSSLGKEPSVLVLFCYNERFLGFLYLISCFYFIYVLSLFILLLLKCF